MKEAVCLILKNSDGLILGVSRKDNHELFGFIGGKKDDTDKDAKSAIIRECFEETGIIVKNLKLIDSRIYGISEETTYLQRNERQPTKQLIKQVATFFRVDEKELQNEFLSDQIAYKILDEEADLNILKVAEKKVSYLKTKKNAD